MLRFAFLVILLVARNVRAAVDARPNIILYLTDDLGYGEINQDAPQWGFPYNPLSPNPSVVARPSNPQQTLSTPSMARAAQLGARALFSYAPSAECAPSRVAIMLGRNVGTVSIRGDTQNAQGMNPNLDEMSFAYSLGLAGYDTAMVGFAPRPVTDPPPPMVGAPMKDWQVGLGKQFRCAVAARL